MHGNLIPVWDRTMQVLEKLYQMGYRRFLCGGATGFDTLAASCVREFRRSFPDAELVLALPCENQTRGWRPSDKALYEELRQEADQVIVLSPAYYTGCMLVRDRFMVDHADRCIAYMRQAVGGTAYTVKYAIRSGLPILNLAVEDEVRRFLTEEEAGDSELPF